MFQHSQTAKNTYNFLGIGLISLIRIKGIVGTYAVDVLCPNDYGPYERTGQTNEPRRQDMYLHSTCHIVGKPVKLYVKIPCAILQKYQYV